MLQDDTRIRHMYRFVQVLRVSDDWLSRAELAAALGQSQLQSYDGLLLQTLVDEGIIEIRRRRTKIHGRAANEYRVKRY